LQRAPRGDGHAVLVFPGLSASDSSTIPLRRYLRSLGYAPRGWDQGFNFGPRAGVLQRTRDALQSACDASGQRVSLLGWSLGGVYARELAKEFPQLVRCVVTLGTPFAAHPKSTHAWRIYELASGRNIDREAQQYDLAAAPPVPTTSVYSRSDGVVAWQGSVQRPDHDRTENVEVVASHLGIGVNPTAWWAVADRLAQDPDRWQRFSRPSLFGLQSLVYPQRQAA
jgi:pimeloyl-ACP methyl ester carboxylesterase